ncbi:MAG: hypothetical protein FJ020_00355 [Chloroflexi bacterium]|nr:hypothetical protein [Chloroflexota bacterium]
MQSAVSIADIVNAAVARLTEDFLTSPARYFSEEDIRWRLIKDIDTGLAQLGESTVTVSGGTPTSAVHGEYPTPFRCGMKESSFKVLGPADRSGRRGHFDVVVLNASSTTGISLEAVRSQDFGVFIRALPTLCLPFLDTVIEIKLYRDLGNPRRARSISQAALVAVQAVKKVAAALSPQPGHYPRPFARCGMVLLLDNSHLAPGANVEPVRTLFRQLLAEHLKRTVPPDTFTGMWITSHVEVWPCPTSPPCGGATW